MAVLIEALRRGEEHYLFSVELNPQIPWISDPEGQLVEVGPRWTELTGTPAEDAFGEGWTNSLNPDALPGVIAHWEEALTSDDNAFDAVRYRDRKRVVEGKSGPVREAHGGRLCITQKKICGIEV